MDNNNNYVESRVKDFLAGLYNLRSGISKNNNQTQTVSCGIKEAKYDDINYTDRQDYKLIKNMIFGDFDYQEYNSKNVLLVNPHHKSVDGGGGVVLERTLRKLSCCMAM